MTDIKLPWRQVYHVIQDMAREYAPGVPQKQVHSSMVEIFVQFGCILWHALERTYPEQFNGLVMSDYDYDSAEWWAREERLEEAHLAKQAKGLDNCKQL